MTDMACRGEDQDGERGEVLHDNLLRVTTSMALRCVLSSDQSYDGRPGRKRTDEINLECAKLQEVFNQRIPNPEYVGTEYLGTEYLGTEDVGR
jgi:hypothetical protein